MVLATDGPRRVERDHSTRAGINVGERERLASVMSGAALIVFGLRRRDWRGVSSALLGAELIRRGASGRCVVYRALGVSTATGETQYPPRARGELVSAAATVDARRAIKIEHSIVIDRRPQDLFAIWRNFDRLPRFISELESVTSLGNGRSRWVAKLPGEKRVEWDAEIVNEIPGQLVAWKTIGDPDVAHAGSVHFTAAPNGRATDMRIVLDYEPPGGRLGALVAAFTRHFGQDPDTKIREELERFKAAAERERAAKIK